MKGKRVLLAGLILAAGLFLFISTRVLLPYFSPGIKVKLSAMVFGDNYRLLIAAPRKYVKIGCVINAKTYTPEIIEIGKKQITHELLLTDLKKGNYTCKVYLKKANNSFIMVMDKFQIKGSKL